MADYPTTAATDASLYVAVDNKETSLTAGIDAVVTTIPVVSTTGFPTVGFVSIDTEIVSYTGTTATSFTGCVRGASGTTAVSHASAATVSHNIVAAHHNSLKEETKAIEADLVPVQSALSDLSPASTSTGILGRIRQIVTQIKNITGMTNWYDTFTFFPISKGGTNSGTALTNNKAMHSSGGAIVESSTTSTELGYLSGVTSAIQTQLNGKVNDTGDTMTGNLAMSGNKVTGLAAATANGDAVRFEQLAPGKIIQVIQATSTTDFSSTSTSYVSTNLSADITPQYTTSKIKITVTGQGGNNTAAEATTYTIALDTTDLSNGGGFGTNTAGASRTTVSMTYIHTPAVLTAITYRVRLKVTAGTGYFGNGGTQVMILEEIAQ